PKDYFTLTVFKGLYNLRTPALQMSHDHDLGCSLEKSTTDSPKSVCFSPFEVSLSHVGSASAERNSQTSHSWRSTSSFPAKTTNLLSMDKNFLIGSFFKLQAATNTAYAFFPFCPAIWPP
ncbi:hypothetical protein PanWU01x14_152080, partial [Parasponia andersonii]